MVDLFNHFFFCFVFAVWLGNANLGLELNCSGKYREPMLPEAVLPKLILCNTQSQYRLYIE